MIVCAPKIVLDETALRVLGAQLKQAREAQNTSVADMADKLLMSKNQILGIEQGEMLHFFYSPRHFLQMVRKYCDLLDIPFPDTLIIDGTPLAGDVSVPPPIQEITPPVVLREPAPAASLSSATPTEKKHVTQQATGKRPLFWGATLVTLLLLTIWLGSPWGKEPSPRNQEVAKHEPTEQSKAVDASSDKPEKTESVIAEPTLPAPIQPAQASATSAPFAILATHAPCWVQLNYTDGKKHQEVYPPNTTLAFKKGELAGIIIGDLNAASLSVSGNKVDLRKYQKPDSNVARILNKDAESLLASQ